MNTYTIGTLVLLESHFTDTNLAPADPDAVTAEVLLPDDSVVDLTPTVVRVSIGYFTAEYLPTQEGLHTYRFQGVGAITAADEQNFVTTSAFN